MDKEYWKYLKENDPIHYHEMMGDPVTGLGSNTSSGCSTFLFLLLLIGVGVGLGCLLVKI